VNGSLPAVNVATSEVVLAVGAGDFHPPPLLENPHVQSVAASLPFRRPFVLWRCRELLGASRPEILDCGDSVRLLAHRATQAALGRPPATRVAVLLHGWEGGARSLYILSIGQQLLDRGFDVVRLNLRDHGGSHDLNPGIFHSCRLSDVVGAVQRLQASSPRQGLNLVGFSLGGNFFLRVAAKAAAAGLELEQVVAICPVLDPEHTLTRLEQGWVVYRRYFLAKWRRSLRRKQAAWPGLYDLREVLALGTLTGMTDHLARDFAGFPSLSAYLHGYAVVDETLATIVHPTRIIAAEDDPIIPVVDLARLARPAALEVTTTRFGGHCGYFQGLRGSTWLEREVCATLGRA
jgi:predicted alpha/beta-fold hydrolase